MTSDRRGPSTVVLSAAGTTPRARLCGRAPSTAPTRGRHHIGLAVICLSRPSAAGSVALDRLRAIANRCLARSRRRAAPPRRGQHDRTDGEEEPCTSASLQFEEQASPRKTKLKPERAKTSDHEITVPNMRWIVSGSELAVLRVVRRFGPVYGRDLAKGRSGMVRPATIRWTLVRSSWAGSTTALRRSASG